MSLIAAESWCCSSKRACLPCIVFRSGALQTCTFDWTCLSQSLTSCKEATCFVGWMASGAAVSQLLLERCSGRQHVSWL